MTFAGWSLFAGVLLLLLLLLGTLLGRLSLSSAMVYLVIGWLLGPDAMNLLTPDPIKYAGQLEVVSEIALLISLFAVGLQLGVPLRDRRWRLPLRLAFVSMTAMVLMIALVGVLLLRLPLGAAVLLGGILAPTDPVLASGVHAESGKNPDRLGFSLAGEGALNDGAAFPFVMLGLGLLSMHDLGPGWARWWSLNLLWATVAGTAIGGGLGMLVGRLVIYLRVHREEALGLDVFLGLGMIATSYGLAQLMDASGFLAVFASGLALQRVREQPKSNILPMGLADSVSGHSYEVLAIHSHHASATMRNSVQLFNGQLEKLAELAVVLLVGAMLAYAKAPIAVWWFVPLVLLVLRPLSTLPATLGQQLNRPQTVMIGWFGIRGIGSIYYLNFALHHGVDPQVAAVLLSLTMWTVATSIVAHGATVRPLMHYYRRRKLSTSPRF